MTDHLLVVACAAPVQLGLAALNTRISLFDGAEMRFWGVMLFLTAEAVYLGLSA